MTRAPSEGVRVRIGVVVPSTNVVMEPDFYAMLPASVSCHFTRAWYRFQPDPDDPRPLDPLPELADDTVRAVPILAEAGVHAISSGSTAGSCFGGPHFDRDLIRRMEHAAPGVRATTPSTAVANSLEALGVRRVSIITPYLKVLNDREVEFLDTWGFSVVNAAGMGITHGRDMAFVPVADTDGFLRAHVDHSADACFISCTNLPVLSHIDQWEEQLGMPVVTSNQATVWMLLQMAGCVESIAGYGRLLATMPAVPAPRRSA